MKWMTTLLLKQSCQQVKICQNVIRITGHKEEFRQNDHEPTKTQQTGHQWNEKNSFTFKNTHPVIL